MGCKSPTHEGRADVNSYSKEFFFFFSTSLFLARNSGRLTWAIINPCAAMNFAFLMQFPPKVMQSEERAKLTKTAVSVIERSLFHVRIRKKVELKQERIRHTVTRVKVFCQ